MFYHFIEQPQIFNDKNYMIQKIAGVIGFIATYFLIFSYSALGQKLNSLCPVPRQGGNNNFYSQYLEDYILSIVLSEVKTGTYVDIGSNSPDIHSVSKYFYLNQWRGINIEPIEKWYQESLLKRPEDINLNIGISDREGILEFFKIYSNSRNNNYRLSTFNKKVLDKAIKDGYEYITYKIPVKTLNQVLTIYPIQNLTFIKIDVEGAEKQVLQGVNLKFYRPIIFIIEATEPRTSIPSYQEWEPILLNNNYEFIMFDGLNRYYLSEEHKGQFLIKFKETYNCANIQNRIYHIINTQIFFNAKLMK